MWGLNVGIKRALNFKRPKMSFCSWFFAATCDPLNELSFPVQPSLGKSSYHCWQTVLKNQISLNSIPFKIATF